ncbi:synaptic vesicle 2-related protein [Dorcoceras hygrometricum]|uniref:Synaptic vesicle 2-related protein n=1 Tax=Dorcoceras hygrometricum TaxID=472368 RepID=A0A2Z7CQW3_9LAMI|nr:synaptic vesicle 2-related protein [Dorcoceras hygrometricum]
MVVDLIGIYGLKGPYCTLTMTDWFLQALSVIPRGSWGDVARRFTMIRWAVLLVQADEGVSVLVVDRIDDIYRSLPRRADVIVTTVGARHKCQQDRLKRQKSLEKVTAPPRMAAPLHVRCAQAIARRTRDDRPKLLQVSRKGCAAMLR